MRQWLHQPHFDTLIEVLASKAFELEVRAANNLTKWNGGEFPDFEGAALKCASECAQINATIKFLKEVREQKEPYYKVTANPS